MAEAGILTERDKVELIEGEILKMSPKGSKHSACVRQLNTFLYKQVSEKIIISIQDPVLLLAMSCVTDFETKILE